MVEGGLFTQQEAASQSPISSGGSVAVTIHLSSNVDDVVQFLEENGGDPRNVGEAYVPVSLLGQLSEQPGVTRVEEIIPPEPSYGNYVSQGVQEHNSQAWNNAGFSGQGVKVGVIDLGFEGLRSLIGSELLSNIQGRCYTDIGTPTDDLSNCEGVDDVTARFPECQEEAERSAALNAVHGTAVSEAVIDIAPAATLYVASPFSRGDMQDVVAWMALEGVSVINYSASYIFDGPGDGTSPSGVSPLNTVDQAVASDILFVTSAGNSADNIWFGDYSGPDGNGAIQFGGQNDEVIDLPFFECRGYTIQLRWEDSWEAASTNLDLHLYNKASDGIVFSSNDEQSGESGQVPFEGLGFTALADSDDYGMVITHHGGPVPDWIQLLYWGPGSFEHYTVSGSIGNPAESANPGMLAVGATHYWDTYEVTSYSSQGPTPDGRVKPDVVGVDCAEAASYEVIESARFDFNPCWFPGTSQASPHLAGLAALVKQRFPHFTPDQTADYLKHYAEQRDTPDPNNTWGHGFAVLPPPGDELAPGFDTSCRETITDDGSYPGQWTVGCESTEAERGHARYYSFTLEQESEVTIDLTSSVDTYLYLREGDSRSGATVEGGENDDIDIEEGNTNSQIVLTLPAGSYTIEATTYAEGETGSFTLTVSVLSGTVAEPGADECEQIITGDGIVPGAWTEGCDSDARSGHHARYYRMTVSDEASVTIDLESEIDAYLFLRRGESRSGDSLNDHASDDDAGEGRNARVEETLEAGTYTIEATTYAAGEIGNFTLTVAGLGGPAPPGEEACDTVPITGSVEGTWSEGCPSSVDARGYARYYSFTMSSEAEVTIDLTSTVDTYLYLRSGEARSGATVEGGEDDDGGEGYNSQIVLTLPAGTYTIEATTYAEGQIGNFTLTVSGLSGTEDTGTDDCEPETIDGDGSVNGTWADGCESEESGRGYARYYSFTLAEESEITIVLESGDADTYLYLREGESRSGGFLYENDDHDGSLRVSQIQQTLAASTYTIEATTYRPRETGSFTLTVSGLGSGT